MCVVRWQSLKIDDKDQKWFCCQGRDTSLQSPSDPPLVRPPPIWVPGRGPRWPGEMSVTRDRETGGNFSSLKAQGPHRPEGGGGSLCWELCSKHTSYLQNTVLSCHTFDCNFRLISFWSPQISGNSCCGLRPLRGIRLPRVGGSKGHTAVLRHTTGKNKYTTITWIWNTTKK